MEIAVTEQSEGGKGLASLKTGKEAQRAVTRLGGAEAAGGVKTNTRFLPLHTWPWRVNQDEGNTFLSLGESSAVRAWQGHHWEGLREGRSTLRTRGGERAPP